MTARVAFLGGNGHCAARTDAARSCARGHAIALEDVAYPGFEGRARVPSLDAFLDVTAAAAGTPSLAYATGIGGLIALLLRARGRLEAPLVLQAPVLAGVESRWMPRLLRVPGIARAARHLLRVRAFQSRFAAAQFTRPPAPEMRRAFFAGYASCDAFADLFVWCGPDVLRILERCVARTPEAFDGIEIWWGGRDHVVTTDELRWAARAFGRELPLHVFPEWGHYPMLDDPAGWAAALAGAARRQCTIG